MAKAHVGLSVQLPLPIYEAFRKLCASDSRSMNSVVRCFIEDTVSKWEEDRSKLIENALEER